MKIRFLKNTNIRSDHHSTDVAPVGVVYANTLLEVDGIIYEGVAVKGINRWWRDLNGWYYWAGETEVVAEAIVETTTLPSTATLEPNPLITTSEPMLPPVASPSHAATEPTPIIPLPDAVLSPEEAVQPIDPVKPPETSSPPVVAVDLVVLPIPDDSFSHASVPEGEWRSLDGNVVLDSSDLESFQVRAAMPTNDGTAALSVLLNIRKELLNWGLEAGQIPSQWWKNQQLTGNGVKIAVLSTGVNPQHPDLKGISPTNLAKLFKNPSSEDSHGIGTQAAIIAAGKGRIAYGVAPEGTLLIGKIGSTPSDITPESLIAGLEWCIVQKADVVAILVDFNEISDLQKKLLNNVIERALEADIVLLAPVGNTTDANAVDRFPASMEGVISVGAHHSFNRRSDFSAKSNHLDFLAPGEGLNTSDLNQGFGANLTNTAIATAYAAGLVALLRQWEKQRNEVYSPADIKALLQDTAHYEGINKGKDTEVGYGILNPQAVLERLMT